MIDRARGLRLAARQPFKFFQENPNFRTRHNPSECVEPLRDPRGQPRGQRSDATKGQYRASAGQVIWLLQTGQSVHVVSERLGHTKVWIMLV